MGNVVSEFDIKEYIEIMQKDTTYKDKLIQSTKRVDNKFISSSKAYTGIYEIYKLAQKPTSYSDFAAGFIGLTSENVSQAYDLGSSGVFVDYIEHSRKYYYLFRAITPHQNASTPSFVYEVELLEDADEIILKYDAFEIEEEEGQRSNTNKFRKFIQIVPDIEHIVIDPAQFSQMEDITVEEADFRLGRQDPLPDQSLWSFNNSDTSTVGYKFIKLRLTSKQTGKKIDLNLSFNLKKANE